MSEDTLCKNVLTDRDAVWFLDSGGPNEAAAMRPCVKLLRPLAIVVKQWISPRKSLFYLNISPTVPQHLWTRMITTRYYDF